MLSSLDTITAKITTRQGAKGVREMNDETFLTVTEAARILNRSGESVRNYERRGILPATKTARGIRLFRQADVLALAKKQQNERLGFQPARPAA